MPKGRWRSYSARKCRRPRIRPPGVPSSSSNTDRLLPIPLLQPARRLVDDVIEPADTRRYLAQALEYLHHKRDFRPPKKHGLIPL